MSNLKKEKIIWSSLFISSIFLYVLTDIPNMFFMIIILLIYGGMALGLTKLTGRNLTVQFMGVLQGQKKEVLKVEVSVKNEDKLPVCCGALIFKVKNKLTEECIFIKKQISFLAKSEKTLRFALESEFSGGIEISLYKIEVFDPFRLFVHVEKQDICAISYIFPSIAKIDVGEEILEQYDMESYNYSLSQKGDDSSEIFGIRSYIPGDSMKLIHWKLSGKLGEIMVRESSLPVENNLMILMDKRVKKGEKIAIETIDKMTELFLSLSHAILKQGVPHTIGWYNYERSLFEAYQISSVDHIYSFLQELLCSPVRENMLSSVDQFIESDHKKNYALYLYVTEDDEAEKDAEKLRIYGNVKIYRTKEYF